MVDESKNETGGKPVKVPRVFGDGRAGPGRPKGIPNRLTIELRAMIEGALDDLGGQDWLAATAQREPAAFLTLLGKLLPKDVTLKGSLDLRAMSLEEIKAEIATLLPQVTSGEHPPEPELC